MDLVNRAYTQFYELYRSLTPAARSTVALLVVSVVFGVGYFAVCPASLVEVDLMSGSTPSAEQLATVNLALAKAKLSGYKIHGSTLLVPSGQEAAYLTALEKGGLTPRGLGNALRAAVNNSSILDCGTERERQVWLIAKQEDLANELRAMPGIEDAYMHCDVDNKPGGLKDKVLTALVVVKPTAAGRVDEGLVQSIRNMVTHAFAGLKPENVAVSDLGSGYTWCGHTDQDADGFRCLSLRRLYEHDLKTKILGALHNIPNVSVEVSVSLDVERPAAASRSTWSANTSMPGSRDGRAEACSQQPNAPATLQPSVTVADASDVPAAGQGRTDHAQRPQSDSLALAPATARVAIDVPMSYFNSLWQMRHSPEAGDTPRAPRQEELERIKREESAAIARHVAQLLPASGSPAETLERVSVTVFQDPIAQPAPAFQDALTNWLRERWPILGGFAAALACLLVLRLLTLSRPAATEPSATSEDTDVDEQPAEAAPSVVPAPHAQGFYGSAPTPRDTLSQQIDDDPDGAAKVLRSWIGKVG